MAVMKVIEVLSSVSFPKNSPVFGEAYTSSSKSWEDATAKAVKQASKSIKNIRSVYVQDQSAVVVDGKVSEYRMALKLTFEVK